MVSPSHRLNVLEAQPNLGVARCDPDFHYSLTTYIDQNGTLLAPFVPPWCILCSLFWPFLFVVRVVWSCDIVRFSFTTRGQHNQDPKDDHLQADLHHLDSFWSLPGGTVSWFLPPSVVQSLMLRTGQHLRTLNLNWHRSANLT